jgi:hypothetical protein
MGGRFVIAAFELKPKPGRERALADVVARHHGVLRGQGLVTARPPYVMQAADGALIEVD